MAWIEIEVDDVLVDQLAKAADLTGLPADEVCRRAIMTFCWISPQARWEFLHLLDHPLVERGGPLYRIAGLLEAFRRHVPKTSAAEEDMATRAAIMATEHRLDRSPLDVGYVEALLVAGRLLGDRTVREIAAVGTMPKSARDAFVDGLHDALERAEQVARDDA